MHDNVCENIFQQQIKLIYSHLTLRKVTEVQTINTGLDFNINMIKILKFYIHS